MSFAPSTPLVRAENFAVAGPIAVAGSLRFADLELVAIDGAEQAHVELTASGPRGAELLSTVSIIGDPSRLAIDVPVTWGILGPRAKLSVRISVPTGSTIDLSTSSGDMSALGGYAVASTPAQVTCAWTAPRLRRSTLDPVTCRSAHPRCSMPGAAPAISGLIPRERPSFVLGAEASLWANSAQAATFTPAPVASAWRKPAGS